MRDQIFICFHEHDKRWLEHIRSHLIPLERQGFGIWDQTQLLPGEELDTAIRRRLEVSSLAIVLLSPDLLASEFQFERIILPILEAAKHGTIKVFWIPIRATNFIETPFAKIQAGWDPSKPLASLNDADLEHALSRISEKISNLAVSAAAKEHSDGSGSGPSSKVFISYESEDEEWIKDLINIMRNNGHEIIESRDIEVGADRRTGIQQLLSRSNVFVAIVSPKYSINNHRGEISIAENMNKTSGGLSILPVAYNIDVDQIPDPLRKYKSISVKDTSVSEMAKIIGDAIDAIAQKQLDRLDRINARQLRIKRGASDYIKQSQIALDEREIAYRRIAYMCYLSGAGALIAGIAFSIRRLLKPPMDHVTTIELIANIIPYALFVTLVLAFVKYTFTLGKSYMNEALRNSDRKHAISFGEFYLNAYADTAQWSEIKEAFQHWNIDQGSHFKAQETKDFDPKLIEQAIEIAKIFSVDKNDNKK